MTAASKLALATAAVVALYVPTLGLPLPESCVNTAAVAGAAPTPSPSCGSDLRECLRLSADMNPPAPFGVRYVTADQVAHCMETFNSCIRGGASRGGNPLPPTSTSSRGGGSKGGIPQHFEMRFTAPDGRMYVDDCRFSGDEVTCTETVEGQSPGDTWDATITGSPSGMTVNGTKKAHLTSPGVCSADYRWDGPVTFSLGSDGTASLSWGPTRADLNWGGPCSDSARSETAPVVRLTGTWRAT